MTIIDVTEANAQQDVIDASLKQLVVVQFWSEQSEDCKALTPILEKIAREHSEQLTLAKINVDEQSALTAQFGVRSLPTVMLLKEGQPVDGFEGVKTDLEVQAVFEAHLPKLWQECLIKAQALMDLQDFSGALPFLRQAQGEQGASPVVSSVLALCYTQLNRLDEASELLAEIKLADQDVYYAKSAAELHLKQQVAKTPELAKLEAAYQADSNDLSIAYALALQLNAEAKHREALALLLTIFKVDRDFQDGAVKTTFMDVLTALGKGDPLAIEYQRKFFSLLY